MKDWRDKIRNPNCKLCPLHESAQYVCLMGDGPLDADIAIIGEAPGAREDEEHRAFVGKAGELLNELLNEAGLDRKECYITNVARCRPPSNRTPDRKEIKTCVGTYLSQELAHLKPKFVLLLGNSALQGLTGRSGITKHRGSLHEHDGYKALATYHPAAVLRNPSLRTAVAADIQRFARMTRGQSAKAGRTTVKIVHTAKELRWLKEQLAQAKAVAYDIETYTAPSPDEKFIRSNFQEWHGPDSMIVSISFSWEEGQAAVLPLHHAKSPWKDPDRALAYLKPVMEDKNIKWVAHNAGFDNRWLAAKGIRVPTSFDTMIAAHLLDENRSKGLKNLSQLLLGADAYDVGDDLRNAFSMPLKALCIYNGKDTDYTLRLYHVFREQLKAEPRLARLFVKLMMPAMHAFVDIELNGVWLDMDRWRKRTRTAILNTNKAYAYINHWTPEELRPINPNSPKQLANLMFNHLGLDILEHTKTGAPSTNESVLLRLAKVHKMPDGLLKYRKWAKYLSTYLLPWRYEHSDADGYIHGHYRLTGTATGRLSGEGGIQQVPRDTFIRALIGAPPGWTWAEADFSQVELRVAAMTANEKRMAAQFARKEDIHSNRASRITGKPPQELTKEERKKAKAVNFGFLFSMGHKKFITYARDNYDVTVTEAEALEIRKQFFADYPALARWHSRQRRLAHRYKRVQNPIGRVRHLPDIDSGNEEIKAEAERQAINSPVQSFASDMMLMALIQLHRLLDPKKAKIVGSVHDALLFNIRDDAVEETLPIIKQVMENPPLKKWFGIELTVPIEVDISVGKHWGEGEDWNP